MLHRQNAPTLPSAERKNTQLKKNTLPKAEKRNTQLKKNPPAKSRPLPKTATIAGGRTVKLGPLQEKFNRKF